MNLIKRKEGVVISNLTLIILVLFVFVIIIFLLGYMFLFANKATDREICKFSLLAATKSKTALSLGEPIFKVDCKRHDVEINLRDVKDKDPDVTDENIYKILQREIYECYGMIPESLFSKRNPLSPTGGMPSDLSDDPWGEWQYKNNICLICSIIKFDRDTQRYYRNLEDRKLSGFNTWLLNNPVPEAQRKLKYILFNKEPDEADQMLARTLDQESPIDPSRTYAIVIRWKAQGVLVDFKIAAYSVASPLFTIPEQIKKFNTMQCLYFRDEDDLRCADQYPVLALLPVDALGTDLSKNKNMEFDTSHKDLKVSGEFCSVIWN
jgi:hypothetical protein